VELKQAASLLAYSLVLKMEVKCFSETLVGFTGLQAVKSPAIENCIFTVNNKIIMVTKLETFFKKIIVTY
jgi:hypothetical protein